MKRYATLILGALILTARLGTINFEGHKETWYDLPMKRVVNKAHDNGIDGEYTIREDGCKMIGEYIICAGAKNRYGEVVKTSRGEGIIIDTGDFAKTEPTTIDIATNWKKGEAK